MKKLELWPEEIWKPIKGTKKLYYISNMGRVKSYRNKNVYPEGRILKNVLTASGYHRVGILIQGRNKKELVHSLVAREFIGPRPKGYDINHKNFITVDNKVENLEYCTHAENIRYSFKYNKNMPQIGEKNWMTKLTTNDVIKIHKMYYIEKNTQAKIMKKYNLSSSSISRILNGKRWKHLDRDKLNLPKRKPVNSPKKILQKTLGGKIIKIFKSASSAARETGIALSNISTATKQMENYTHAGGYKWEYI